MAETTERAASPSIASELAAVPRITEDTVVRITGSTPPRPDQEPLGVDDVDGRVRAEVGDMRAWRDRAAPMISSLHSTVDDVLDRVGEIGVQLDEALRPVTVAITRLRSQLASLDGPSADASGPAEPSDNGDGAMMIELPEEQVVGRDGWRPEHRS